MKPGRNALVAVVHLPTSMGYPTFAGRRESIDAFMADMQVLVEEGFDGALLENENDKPHTILVSKAQVAWMTELSHRAREKFRRPLGIGVQRMDWEATIAIAAATGLDFVRLDTFVDEVEMMGERILVNPSEIVNYRASLKRSQVELWTDVQVKHATLLSKRSIGESAKLAEESGSDLVFVTSERTGTPPTIADLDNVKKSLARARVGIGSGLSPENAKSLVSHTDIALVGTALKDGERISRERARTMVSAWRNACESLR